MEQVLDVYKRPYNEDYPVVCMDESPKQLIKETKIPVCMKAGQSARQDFEYERCGVSNIFMTSEPLKGKRYVKVTERKTKTDWAMLIKEIEGKYYKDAKKITLVMDNLNTHKPSALYETFSPREAKRIWDRFEFIYTPRHGSWLNMAEIELNVLTRQCLARRIPDKQTLTAETTAWQNERNRSQAAIDWQFTTKDARRKLKHLYPKNQS